MGNFCNRIGWRGSTASPAPGRVRRRGRLAIAWMAACALAAAALAGCGSSEPVVKAPGAAAGPLYTGPAYLRGTVSSLARIQNFRPMLVSGYGLVTSLNDTGSTGVPAYLRQKMLQELRRGGFGSAKLGPDFENMTPKRVLADPRTAVVAVYGMIPPGATKGIRFDLVVQALPGTQTTSLAGGTLYMTQLSEGGTRSAQAYTTPLAKAHGSVYINPAQTLTQPGDARARAAAAAQGKNDHAAADDGGNGDSAVHAAASSDAPDAASDSSDDAGSADDANDPQDAGERGVELARRALVVSGGRVTKDRRVELILNQPSWNRSQIIADRINERFPASPEDHFQTAQPQNDRVIRLNIPKRFATRPGKLISLIGHLYTQRAPGFEPVQARRLGRLLADNPDTAGDVISSWEALGKTIYPVLRDYYKHKKLKVRFAALQAGAWLGDGRAGLQLQKIAKSDDPSIRARAAESLVYLPDSVHGERTLKKLLDDDDPRVRIAAYESLARMNDPILDRVAVRDPEGDIKFVIDRVPVDKPMVYVTPARIPRLVIFKPQLSFKAPMLARVWHSRLMVRQTAANKPAKLFYMAPRKAEGKTYRFVPTVAALAYVLGHQPTVKMPQDGLNFSFSQVVDVIYQMCQRGDINAPVRIRLSPLVASINRARQNERRAGHQRPETGPPASPSPPPSENTPGATAENSPAAPGRGNRPKPGAAAGGRGGAPGRPESSAGRGSGG